MPPTHLLRAATAMVVPISSRRGWDAVETFEGSELTEMEMKEDIARMKSSKSDCMEFLKGVGCSARQFNKLLKGEGDFAKNYKIL